MLGCVTLWRREGGLPIGPGILSALSDGLPELGA